MSGLCLSTSLLAFPSQLLAESADGASDEVIVIGIFDRVKLTKPSESASRLGLTLLETPASVDVIDGEAIRLRGDLTIQEAAGRTTGIVNTSGVFGYGLSARGFVGVNSVMQLYDGMRMYNNTLTFPADPWMAERVEILRGPASVLYGEGAIGGAVNVVRKQPSDTANHALRAGFGSYGFFTLAAGSGGPITDQLSYRMDGSYRRSDGWMDRGDMSAGAFSGSLRYKATDDLLFMISHDFSRQKPRTWFGVPLINGALDKTIQKKNYNVTDADLRFTDNWGQFKAEWIPADNLKITSDFYHLWANKYWRNAENATHVAATNTTPAAIRQSSMTELYHIQKQTGNRTTVDYSHTLAGRENHFVIGFDVNRISYKNISNAGNSATRLLDIDNPLPGEFISSLPTTARYTNNIHQYSIFIENRFVISDALSAIGGLRYDRPKIKKDDYVNPNNNFTTTPDAVTWRGGIVYTPVPNLSLYGLFSTAADPVGALVSTSSAQSTRDLSTGRQWEAGIKHVFWNGRAQWTFAAYDIVKKKLLTTDPLNSTIQIQVGQQSSQGLEASFFLQATDSLAITANGSLLKARYDDFMESVSGVLFDRTGNKPNNVASKAGNIFVSWSFAQDWTIDGGINYVGKRYQDAANTRELPSYIVSDLGLRWQFINSTNVSLRARNLFDETYARATYGSQWVLGDPRTIELTLNANF